MRRYPVDVRYTTKSGARKLFQIVAEANDRAEARGIAERELHAGGRRAARFERILSIDVRDPIAPPPGPAPTFGEGTRVRKPNGYAFDGVVVAAFHTTAGALRYVVEHETITGMLHIFSGAQLEER